MLINNVISNLWAWLETWRDEKGGVHGYVVHHHRDNLKFLSPDTWTQAPCIIGLLRIYQKTGQKKWLDLAERLCNYLVDTYLLEVHVYQNSNHERKPLGSPGIIHNALASYALLEATRETTDREKQQTYLQTAKDNVQNFLLRRFNESAGSLVSIYHGKPAYIHNMNSAAILALTALSELEQNQIDVEKYAKKIGKHIIACQVNYGPYEGAYPYVNTEKNYRTLYSLITSIGLIALYQKTNDNNFLLSVEKLVRHLSYFFDEETGLICHYHKSGYPQWVPDTLLYTFILKQLEREGKTLGIVINEILDNVLTRQYRNGGFPLSLGFEDLSYQKGLPSRPNIKRWRDVLPTPNWNAWNFWMLAELLPENTHISEPNITFPFTLETDQEEKEGPYKIIEDRDKVTFVEKEKKNIVGIFKKKSDIADFCLIKERSDYWRAISSLNKYPPYLRKLILKLPNL